MRCSSQEGRGTKRAVTAMSGFQREEQPSLWAKELSVEDQYASSSLEQTDTEGCWVSLKARSTLIC